MICTNCNKNPAVVSFNQITDETNQPKSLCLECMFQIATGGDISSLDGLFKNLPGNMGGSIKLSTIMPINPGESASLEHIFKGLMNSLTGAKTQSLPMPETLCTTCGMNHEDFKNGGKFGCNTCIQAFSNEINALLKNIHGSTKHTGKFPKTHGNIIKTKHQVDSLRHDLKKAIEDENYEQAALLRDQIRKLEAPNE